MTAKYILDGRKVVPASLTQWANWFEKADRIVAKTPTPNGEVSTVFLGIDHSFGLGGPPLLFETLVFDGPMDGEMNRYSTWEQAELGHAEMVERVRNAVQSSEHQEKT